MKPTNRLTEAVDYILYLEKLKKTDRWEYDKLMESGEMGRALNMLKEARKAMGDTA